MSVPRYLRFAQSLALCSGIGMLPACSSTASPTDADAPTTRDSGSIADTDGAVDAGALADAGMNDAGDCNSCDCGGQDAGIPSCDSVALSFCCGVVGPLAPPELHA